MTNLSPCRPNIAYRKIFKKISNMAKTAVFINDILKTLKWTRCKFFITKENGAIFYTAKARRSFS